MRTPHGYFCLVRPLCALASNRYQDATYRQENVALHKFGGDKQIPDIKLFFCCNVKEVRKLKMQISKM